MSQLRAVGTVFDPTLRATLQDHLQAIGFEATLTPNLEPRHLNRSQPCDVIIWDYATLDGSFAQTIKHLRLTAPQTPVIAIGTPDATEAEVIDALRAGALDYISPHRLERLNSTLRDVLHSTYLLKESQALLEACTDIPTVGVFSIRHTGEVHYLRGPIFKTRRIDPAETIGKHFSEVPRWTRNMKAFIAEALAGQKTVEILDESKNTWEVRARRITAPDGSLVGIVGTVLDMTLNTLTWRELHRSDLRFEQIFKSLPVPTLILTVADGIILNANDNFFTMTEYTPEEVLGQPLTSLDLLAGPEDDHEFIVHLNTTRALTDYDAQVYTKHHQTRQVIINTRNTELAGQVCALVMLRDMTDYHEAQRSRQRFEQQFQAIFNDSNDVIMLVDGYTGEVMATNRATFRLLGYGQNDLIGKHFSALFPNSENFDPDRFLNELDIHGSVFGAQTFRQADGTEIPMDLTASIIKWGEREAILVTLRDVRDREAVQQALREAQRKLQTVVNNAPVTLFALDREGHFTVSEGRGLASLGLKPGEVVGQSAFDLYQDLPEVQQDIHRALRGESFETLRDAFDQIFETYWNPLTDEQGNLIGTIGLTFDVTERELARRALRIAQQRLQTVVSNADMILFATDAQGVYTLVEGKALATLDMVPGDAVGESTFERFKDFRAITNNIRRALNGEEFRDTIVVHDVIFEVNYTPFYDAQDEISGMIGVAFDVTERERNRATQLEAAREWARLEKERDLMVSRESFLHMVYHEFRNPLAVITYSAEVLRTRSDMLSAEAQKRHYRRIDQESRYMVDLLQDVSLVSQAQSGRLEAIPETYDLLPMVDEIVERVDLGADSEHQFSIGTMGDLSIIYGFKQFTGFILTNLLNNAVKYTPSTGKITLSLTNVNGWLTIIVSDEGIGIPEKHLKSIFEIFYRAPNAKSIKGTGLGLAMVKFAVDAHGGEIKVESVADEQATETGTTFTVKIPSTPEALEAALAAAQKFEEDMAD